MAGLVAPHGGGGLRPLQVEAAQLAEERRRALTLPRVRITSREKGDLVMLGIGGFTPLEGFMGCDDWRSVCDELHHWKSGPWQGFIQRAAQAIIPLVRRCALFRV